MNADEAAARSKVIQEQREEAERVRRQQEKEARAKRIEEMLPEAIRSANAEIAKAVERGAAATSLHVNEDMQYGVEEALRKAGYQTHAYSADVDMGDSAAPCRCTFHMIDVRWRKS